MWVLSLGQEDPLEKEMATQSSILAREIPWTEKPGGRQSLEPQRVRHDWAINTNTYGIGKYSLHILNVLILSSPKHCSCTGSSLLVYPSPHFTILHSALCSGKLTFYFFGCGQVACGILVPWPVTAPTLPALEAQSLSHWTAKAVFMYWTDTLFYSPTGSWV